MPPYLKKANMAQSTSSEDSVMENNQQQHETSHEGNSIGFTIEQQQALLALLNQPATTSNSTVHHLNTSYTSSSGNINLLPSNSHVDHSWILDIGSTYHVCHSKDMFTYFIDIKQITVRLPDGNVIQTQYVGTVIFTNDFYLSDVLYIPSFFTYLIYVPKLINHLQCQIIFNSPQCFIQGIHTLRKIGATELLHGLYVLTYLILNNSLNQFSHINYVSSKNCDLWQQRLRHPCNDTLLHINKISPISYSLKSHTPCDACLFSKKMRLLFPLSLLLLSNRLNLSIWIFGDPFSPVLWKVSTFLLLLMILAAFVGFIWWNQNLKLLFLSNLLLTLSKTNFKPVSKQLGLVMDPNLHLKIFLNSMYHSLNSMCWHTSTKWNCGTKAPTPLGLTRALLFQSKLQNKYWVHDLSQIVFLINKISSRLLKYKTPFTLLFDSIPDYNALRIFGFLAYDTSSRKNRSKLYSISHKCIYLEKNMVSKAIFFLKFIINNFFVSWYYLLWTYLYLFQKPK